MAKNVPLSIFVVGVICFVLMVPGAFFIQRKSLSTESLSLIKNDQRSESVATEIDTSDSGENEENGAASSTFHLKKYIFNRSFLLLLITSCNVSLQVFFISLNFKVYGTEKINDDHYLMTVLVVSQIVASLSKFVWGYAIDKMSFKLVLNFSLLLGGIFTVK